jgi:NitT/TauT family transport system ATP-binding protein
MATGSASLLCEMKKINKRFPLPTGGEQAVLRDIDLDIFADEVVALLGPSGCGKSTLLRVLTGLIPPTSGQVLVHGRPLQGINPHVAMVFQNFALYPWLTVWENVDEGIRVAVPETAARRQRVAEVLTKVGLTGHEEAYPRELSGGMKQRVGLARALGFTPEILCMDEAFSALDPLTAEGLRAEVLDLWRRRIDNPKTVFMVSHDIREVVFMADRIVIMGANPGHLRQVLDNALPRPRDYRSPAFLRMVDRVHDLLTQTYLPDAVPAPPAGVSTLEPLPQATPSEILGLVETLAGYGGQMDLFELAGRARQEFGRVAQVVLAAEMLDFVDTPRRLVVLTPLGRALVEADTPEQQRIFRQQIKTIHLVQTVLDMLQRAGPVARDDVLDHLALHLPNQDPYRLLETLLQWGRFADLINYDETTNQVKLG